MLDAAGPGRASRDGHIPLPGSSPPRTRFRSLWGGRHVRRQPPVRSDQGQGRRIRRFPVHRPARQVAASGLPRRLCRRGPVERRDHVRRLVDRRLEGNQRIGHGADARSGHRRARPLRRPDHRHCLLRRLRARYRRGLSARSTIDGAARRGLPCLFRDRRYRLFRPGGGVFRIRRRPLRSLHAPMLLLPRFDRGASCEWSRAARGQYRPPTTGQGWLLPGPAGRLGQRTCVPRWSAFSRKWA